MRQWQLEFKLEAGGFCYEADVPDDALAVVEAHPYLNRSFEQAGALQLFSQEEMEQIYSTVFFSLVEEIKEYKKLYIPLELINSLGIEQSVIPILQLAEEEGGVFLKPADPYMSKSLARFLVPRISTHGKTHLKMLCPVLSISGGNEDE